MALVRRSRATTWLLALLTAATAGAACLWIGSAAASPSRPPASIVPRRAAHTGPVLGPWSIRAIKSVRLWSVSCPTSSFCLAVGNGPARDSTHGYVYTYSHGKWSAGHMLDRHTYQDAVSCASPSFCMMVDNLPAISPAGYQGGYAFTYSRGRWSPGRKITSFFTDVSCAARSFCAATGLHDAYIYAAGKWSPGHLFGPRLYPAAISCASRSFCLALTVPWSGNGPGGYATYSRGTWSPVRFLHNVDWNFLDPVSCASAQSCLATAGGMAYVYSHGRWQPGVRIGPALDSPAVSCTASFLCVAVTDGWADVLSDTRWSGHITIARHAYFEAISCAAGPFCMAVGAGARTNSVAAWAHARSR